MDILRKEYCTRRGRALEAFRTRAKSRGRPVTSDRPPLRRCGQAAWAAAGRPINNFSVRNEHSENARASITPEERAPVWVSEFTTKADCTIRVGRVRAQPLPAPVQWPLAQLLNAPAFWFTRFPGRKSSPSGDARAASITPGLRLKSIARGTYLPPEASW